MRYTASAKLFEQAKKYIPGGVNSPVRACRSVGCDPIFITKATGATLTDADGNECQGNQHCDGGIEGKLQVIDFFVVRDIVSNSSHFLPG